MAALGNIRKRGVTLIIIIGLGLFAFIAEEAFRSCNGIKGEKNQQVGEILGQKVSVQDFQKLMDEYQDAMKFIMRTDNLNEEQLNQLKDQVWQQLCTSRLIENDAEKVGLTVTDQEVQNVLNEGTNQMLTQTPFINQQTGRFDVNTLKQFLDQYNKAKSANPQQAEQAEPLYKYWLFIEKQLRTSLLQQKYQDLIQNCVLSNKVEAKLAFKDQNEEASVQLAVLPYSSIKDDAVKITEDDMKAKYEQLKLAFINPTEERDIKYVDYQIKASSADRSALQKEMNKIQTSLAAAPEADVAHVMSTSGTQVPYVNIARKSSAFPTDIASKMDSMAVGTTSVFENKEDNTLNIVRIFSKEDLPDSVQYRQIQVAAQTPEQAHQKADSIMTALQGGADFATLAKRYGQDGQEQWFTGEMYEQASTMGQDDQKFINALIRNEVGAPSNVVLTQGNIILQVMDRKAMKPKFNAAVVKRVIDFSKGTRSKAYNQFSEFVAKSPTQQDIIKNAPKFGYKVQDLKGMTTSEHYVANIHATRDAMKWIFDAEKGDVSPLYECGDNDHLLIVMLTGIHPQGFLTLDDPQVREIVKREVLKDKKAEMLMAKLKGVNSIAAAKAKGATVTTVDHITFAMPAFIQTTGMAEPALSGAVAATAQGKFCKAPVKGNGGVYLFQVTKKGMKPGVKYTEKVMMQAAEQQNLQIIMQATMRELVLQGDIVDNRYLFF